MRLSPLAEPRRRACVHGAHGLWKLQGRHAAQRRWAAATFRVGALIVSLYQHCAIAQRSPVVDAHGRLRECTRQQIAYCVKYRIVQHTVQLGDIATLTRKWSIEVSTL